MWLLYFSSFKKRNQERLKYVYYSRNTGILQSGIREVTKIWELFVSEIWIWKENNRVFMYSSVQMQLVLVISKIKLQGPMSWKSHIYFLCCIITNFLINTWIKIKFFAIKIEIIIETFCWRKVIDKWLWKQNNEIIIKWN